MANFEISDELRENYEQLRESRGWSWETLAENVEPQNKALSGYFRSRAEADKPKRAAGKPDKGHETRASK